jgi:DNA-binding transcriptional LysR family regulator
MMDALSLDQIHVLLTVVEQGSFSGAARRLNRAQSAITYAVQKLEDQLGTPLFDRSSYRPTLTEAGRALLPAARRIATEVGAFKAQAHGMAQGLEAELSLVVDALFPMALLLEALRAFSAAFPSVTPRVYVEALGGSAALVLDGTCTLGLLPAFFSDFDALDRVMMLSVEMRAVAAPSHPLAGLDGPATTDTLRDHVQLVLTDRSRLSGERDHGVVSQRIWRVGDLGAKHTMLRAGLGWGAMPMHMIEDDLRQGRLRLIARDPEPERAAVTIPMCCARLETAVLGPAARWMHAHLLRLQGA